MTPFLGTVLALGSLAAVQALMSGPIKLTADFLLLVVLACIAAPHTLNLGHNARITTLEPFLLAAIALFGVKEAMLLALISMTYFWIVGRPRLPIYKALFNVGTFVLATWCGGHAFSLAGGRVGDVTTPDSLLGLLLATLAFFAINTSLVSIAVGLEHKIPPSRVWYEKYSWTLNTLLAGAALVIPLGILRQAFGISAFFVILPYCVMTYHFYKAYFPRASQRAHQT